MPALHDGHSRFYSSLRVMKESVTAGGLLLSQADVGKALSCPPAGHGGLAGTAWCKRDFALPLPQAVTNPSTACCGPGSNPEPSWDQLLSCPCGPGYSLPLQLQNEASWPGSEQTVLPQRWAQIPRWKLLVVQMQLSFSALLFILFKCYSRCPCCGLSNTGSSGKTKASKKTPKPTNSCDQLWGKAEKAERNCRT